MKLGIDKATKQTFLGGVAGGLIAHLEEAAYELVPGYPTQLGNKINPNLPRNGQLLATGGPLVAAWAAPKVFKRHSAGMDNVKLGITLYDGPNLLFQIVKNVAYQLGAQTLGYSAPLAYRSIAPMSQASALGKFTVTNSIPAPNYSGLGKYRAV